MSRFATPLALVAALTVPAAPHAAAIPGGAPRIPVVTITARDYAFDAPDTLTAGATTIRLVNRGPALHHAYLVRLEQGKTLGDLARAMQGGGPPPRWMVDVGGPNAPVPGAESVATVSLEPGNYALLCVIPASDGMPHVMKGMAHPITVVPSAARPALPAADVAMTLKDYGFELSRPLTSGKHLIAVTNAAAQSHEAVFARLVPGKTVADLLAWVEKPAGPPPAMLLGGSTPMATGVRNVVSVDLTPGEYVLLCFVPDAKDGKPHVAHGMTRQITVK